MKLRRLLSHLTSSRARQHRLFPPAVTDAITEAVRAAEAEQQVRICFVVESSLGLQSLLRGQAPRARALEVFELLRLGDTAHHDGVLIYVLMADHAVEIVADHGVRGGVSDKAWAHVCRQMEAAHARGDYLQGSREAILEVRQILGRGAPAQATPVASRRRAG